MSLLLDALKRAEQEKLAKQGERPDADKARAVAATPANEPSNASLELAPLASAAEPAPTPSAGARADAAAAKNVFQAKEGAPPERSRKGILLWIGLAALVAIVAAAGIYVWMSVNAFTPRTVASARPRPSPLPISPSPNSTPPNLEVLMAPPQQPSSAIQPPQQPSAAIQPPPAIESVRPDAGKLAAELLRDAPRGAPPVKLAPSVERARVPVEVTAGYDALRMGDLGAARRSYATAVANDPTNVDARLGAATIEARSGNRMLAAMHYRKALEADPRNATALAGLASIGDFAQPDGLEAKLRSDLSRSPDSPQLHFALGNLYASQRRWGEAQGEYFEAHRLDPANPDVLFNFSVALDHLGQARLAADYYRRTLEASRGQATQFDPAAVQRRLSELR
jgi:Tfp pilus assembly protein PilF